MTGDNPDDDPLVALTRLRAEIEATADTLRRLYRARDETIHAAREAGRWTGRQIADAAGVTDSLVSRTGIAKGGKRRVRRPRGDRATQQP